MHIYFIIYTLVFLTMFADSSRISIQKKKIILFFDIVVLTLFFGLRWQCGTDWWQYYNVFRYVTWSNFYCLNRYGDQNMEIGFAFVNVLLKQFGNYTFYLIVTNFIRFVLMAYVSITLSKTPIVTFFGFLSLQFLQRQSSGIRKQGLRKECRD